MSQYFDILIKNAQLRGSSGLSEIGILNGNITSIEKVLERTAELTIDA